MKTEFDIEKIIKHGVLETELDYERALQADRKLRILSKENPQYKELRSKIRNLIVAYEANQWRNSESITQVQIKDSETAELIAENEQAFYNHRKSIIKSKLKEYQITQQELGLLLGHKSKTHISELINGICPFTMKDIVLISRLLKIEFSVLIPTYLSTEEQNRVKIVAHKLNKPQIKLSKTDLILV